MSSLPSPDAGFDADEVIVIGEHEETPSLDVSPRALQMLRSEVNQSNKRIRVEFTADESVRLHTGSYVGLLGLPDGPAIDIRPKVATAHLLYLLQYSSDITVWTFEEMVSVAEGSNFVDAVGSLFEAELRQLLRNGLRKEYREVSSEEPYLRGRLNVQNQLQRQQGTAATTFDCTYSEMTYDTTLNQAVLHATEVLTGLVSEQRIATRLQTHAKRLQQSVSSQPVSVAAIRRIQLSQLTEQYRDILRLVEMILANSYVEDYAEGMNRSFSLLVNMNTVFEKVVERGFRTAASTNPEVDVLAQNRTGYLIDAGGPRIGLKPDIALRTSDGGIICVADAKWKIGNPSNQDAYQLAAYQQTHRCPGVLVYPEQSPSVEFAGELPNGLPTGAIQVPVGRNADEYQEFVTQLEDRIQTYLNGVVDTDKGEPAQH